MGPLCSLNPNRLEFDLELESTPAKPTDSAGPGFMKLHQMLTSVKIAIN